jgi:hypothetical protein
MKGENVKRLFKKKQSMVTKIKLKIYKTRTNNFITATDLFLLYLTAAYPSQILCSRVKL